MTGPSFVLVAGWASRGIPLTVAFAGIDRYFERYYRAGPRRRPVKIDFCEADVLDAFDEWRRATGVLESSVATRESSGGDDESDLTARVPQADAVRSAESRRRPSLPAHLERVVLRLSSARAAGTLGADADDLIDRVARELDAARAGARSLRGDARSALVERLAVLDRELLDLACRAVDAVSLQRLQHEADAELAPFRSTMAPDAYARARQAATDRLVRNHWRLPTIAFD